MFLRLRIAYTCLFLTSAFVTGCMTIGDKSVANANAKQITAQIINGKTNMAEIRVLFGDTQAKTTNDSGEMWYYSAVNHRLINANVKTLAVYFNKLGIVTKHVYSEHSQSEVF